MILWLSPRLSGKQIHVLVRSGDGEAAMRSNGLLTFNAAEYRFFLSALRQGANQMSPEFALRVDNVQLGGV